MKKIIGMGNALVDVLVPIPDISMLEELKLPVGSMQLIDQKTFESISHKILNMESSMVSGGSASNTVVGLAKLGIHSGFIGKLGNDGFGNLFKDDLKRNQVLPLVETVENNPSGVATTFILDNGERTFATFLGASSLLTPTTEHISSLDGFDYFYMEGYLVQSHQLVETMLSAAKQKGLTVILDLASYNVVEANKDFLMKMISSYVDIVFANEDEAKALFSTDAYNAAEQLSTICNIAVVKIGEKGSWIAQSGNIVHVEAFKTECVDATGAGDLYASGFIYGLLNACDLFVCGQIGSLLASRVIAKIGAKIQDEEWIELKKVIPQFIQQ